LVRAKQIPAGGSYPHPLGDVCSTSQWTLVTFQGGFRSIMPPSTQWTGVC